MKGIFLFGLLASSAFAAAPTCSAGTAFKMTPGVSYQLDGSGSHSNNGNPSLTYQWVQLNGRTRLRWSSQTVVQPTIRGVVAGLYYLKLTVKDSDGATSSCTVSPVGLPGPNATAKPVAIAFNLASVPNASQVRCTMVIHTGQVIRATATTSPCRLQDPSPAPDVYYTQLEFLDSAGKVLAASNREFQPYNDPLDTHTRLYYPIYTTLPAGDLGIQIRDFLASRFDFLVGGNDFRPSNPNVLNSGYLDSMYVYAGDNGPREAAAAHALVYEDMFSHSTQDYTVNACNNPNGTSGNCNWVSLDQFDSLDKVNGNATNGVLLLNGSTYTDKTGAAYDSTANDVSITDKLLVGYSEPFDRMNFTLGTVGSNITVAWQYWNGSNYAPLTLASDTTSGLSGSGLVVFTPPVDWTPHAENGSRSKYWVRAVVTGSGTKPVASRIFGDDWHAGANVARGWNATDPNRVNVGLGPLEYNPNPPAGATARFRYQARLTGMWAPNSMLGNHGNIQNGIPSWGQYLVEGILAQVNKLTVDTVVLDDAGPQGFYPQNSLDVPQGTTLGDQVNTCFSWVSQTMKSLIPSYVNFYNGANGDFVDFTVLEAYAIANAWTGTVRTDFYDKYVGSNTIPVTVYFNHVFNPVVVWPFAFNTSNWTWWDNADRFSMYCLIKHYIGGKERNYFSHTQDGYYYPDQDEYFYVDATPTTTLTAPYGLSTTLTANVTYYGTSEYEIPVASIAGFPAPGTNFSIRIGTPNSSTGQMLTAYTKADGKMYVTGQYVLPHNTGDEVFWVTYGQTLTVGSTAAFAKSTGGWANSIWIRIGDPASGGGDLTQAYNPNGTQFTTDHIFRAYPAGTPVYVVKSGHQATDVLPPLQRLIRWGQYFPAMSVDIGTYDVNGVNGGARVMSWKTGSSIAQDSTMCGGANHRANCADLARRDYTKAAVFFRGGGDNGGTYPDIGPVWPSAPVCITGGTYPSCTGPDYYQLHANGKTGPGQKYVQLRELEGAVMMKQPIP